MDNPVIAVSELKRPAIADFEADEQPGKTLRAIALAAVAACIGEDRSPDECPEVQFLLSHLDCIDPNRAGWETALYEYLRAPAPDDAPLIRLAEEMKLTLIEMVAVSLAASVEDDAMTGRALAYAQAPLGGSRPTLGLLGAALRDLQLAAASPIGTLLTGVAMQTGLLTVIGEGAPMPERAVAVPLPLCLALNGDDGVWPGATIGLSEIAEVPLPPSIATEAWRQASALCSSSERALVIRTGSAAEARSVASLIAESCGRRALFIETDKIAGVVPWLIVRNLLPVFCFELGPGERKVLPHLPRYSGPVLALCGFDGSIEGAG